jgi:hypothetical protein
VTRMSKAFGEIGDCSRSDNVNALDTTLRAVARTLAPALSEGMSASSDAYLSSASRRPVLLDSHPKNPLLVLAFGCVHLTKLAPHHSAEKHIVAVHWSPVNQRSRVSIAFLHHVGTPSSTLKSNPTANAGLSKPAPALELVSWQRPNIDSLSAIVIPRRHRLSLIQSAPT